MIWDQHRAKDVLILSMLPQHWLSSERLRLCIRIKGYWYRHIISNLDKLHLNTVHLPGSETARWVLGTSHRSGYLRPHAAQLMDKCVNMRSIWAERPHKPHLIPSWALKYQSIHSTRYRSKSRKIAVWNKKDGVNMACEWWLPVSSDSCLKCYLYKV